MILLQLFWEFFKTGLFAVGGGMATLPFLYDMSTRTGWFTQAKLADMIAEQNGAEVDCHFCNTRRRFTAEELRVLIGRIQAEKKQAAEKADRS